MYNGVWIDGERGMLHERLISTCKSTQRYDPEDQHRQICRHVNLSLKGAMQLFLGHVNVNNCYSNVGD
jgi:hypothetical protein